MSRQICKIPDCDRVVNGWGLCGMHYKRQRKHGDVNYVVPKASAVCAVAGCDSGQRVTNGLCTKHYERSRKGKPLNTTYGGVIEGTQEFMFWQKVAVTANPDRCWVWMRGTDKDGYGQAQVDRQKMKAHIAAFRFGGGLVSDNEPIVLHSCDNPPCCNPNHLRAGTVLENNREALARHRVLKATNGQFASPQTSCASAQENNHVA